MPAPLLLLALLLGPGQGLAYKGQEILVFGTDTAWSFHVGNISAFSSLAILIHFKNFTDAVFYSGGTVREAFLEQGKLQLDPKSGSLSVRNNTLDYFPASSTNNAPLGQFGLNGIFAFCLYSPVVLGQAPAGERSCGSYHTFSSRVNNDPYTSRNMGVLQKSIGMINPANSLPFNVSYYLDLGAANIVLGMVISTNEASAWKTWAAIGIGNNGMEQQDILAVNETTGLGDYYSTYRGASLVALDNDTSRYRNCTSDVALINGGKSFTYHYSHFTRPLVTRDLHCDTGVFPGWTDICMVWRFMNFTNETVFQAKHSGIMCSGLSPGYTLAALLSAAALIFM
jgi:hypothetical protein